ncbi:MAG: hypothetical protein J6Z04_02570 [Clostridia bacterium]|nr:hypothetical protein [Clostridia bacterium]
MPETKGALSRGVCGFLIRGDRTAQSDNKERQVIEIGVSANEKETGLFLLEKVF